MSQTALEYAVKILSKKDYSQHKLTKKLRDKNYSEEEVSSAVETLQKKRYLRDDVYAEDLAINLIQRSYGDLFIKEKLAHEKLLISDQALNGLRKERSLTEEIVIQQLIEKKLTNSDDLNSSKVRKRIYNYLLSRGFASELFSSFFQEDDTTCYW